MLRTSVVLGYLVAGTVIGPHALGLLGHNETIDLLAELLRIEAVIVSTQPEKLSRHGQNRKRVQ